MKQTITNVIMVIALILLSTACQREECPCNKEKRKNNNQTLTVNSGITGLRAYNNTWSANDAIGIFSSTLQSENVKFTTTSEGENVTFTTATPITIPYSTTATHTVTAYYPYSTVATTSNGVAVSIPTSTPLLFAQGSVTSTQPHLNLQFTHQLAEVKITINATALKANQLQSVKLKEVNNQATLNVATGKATATGTPSEATLLPREKESESDSNVSIFVYHTFIAPGEKLTGKELIVEVDNRTYTIALKQGDNTDNALAGYRYEYTYTLTSGDQILGSTEAASITTPTVVPINGGSVNPDGTTPSTPNATTEADESTADENESQQPSTSNLFPNDISESDIIGAKSNKALKVSINRVSEKEPVLRIKGSQNEHENKTVATLKSHLTKIPKNISFQIKGSCQGLNFKSPDGSHLQLYTEGSNTDVVQVQAQDSGSYTKSLNTENKWVLVNLDLTTLQFKPGLKLQNNGILFEIKFKKASNVNIEFKNFKVIY